MHQFGRAARINEDFVHIEIVNKQGKYKCIIMGSDYSGWVYRRKGYGAIDWLNRCAAL